MRAPGRLGSDLFFEFEPVVSIPEGFVGLAGVGIGQGAGGTVVVTEGLDVVFAQGQVEIDGVAEDIAREALRLAAAKLPVRTRFVQRIAD